MFKFNNTHIFTGYLKQKLSSVNLPACKIYTKEFEEYKARYNQEDPRVIESIDSVIYGKDDKRLAVRVNYLKNNEYYHYFWNYSDYEKKQDLGHSQCSWKRSSTMFYSSDKAAPGFTKSLCSQGRVYDKTTHEYLGEYLRFLRDYHGINLMSLYNCFNNHICNNIYFTKEIGPKESKKTLVFNSQDSKYRIYAIPVKLFANYTIAIDSYNGVEMFCGLYNTNLDVSDKAIDLISRTYKKVGKTIFRQPFLYDALDVSNWLYTKELHEVSVNGQPVIQLNNTIMSRWDLANREQDLKLFIKVPTSCNSSIVILEGDYRGFNDCRYTPSDKGWKYEQNHTVLNFNVSNTCLNNTTFKPIGKLQLLEFNTGESHPFADRLVEYLSDSAITPIDEISDNIKRAQRVMQQNNSYFKIEGIWENKMQKIIYDYVTNAGPMEIVNGKIVDKRLGYLPRLGHTSKSTLYDVLGYVDKDAEKWYASWGAENRKENGKAVIKDNILNVDIYDGLYDI